MPEEPSRPCKGPAYLADGIDLTVEHGPDSGKVPTPSFAPPSPQDVTDPSNLINTTSQQTYPDVPPPGTISYLVTGGCASNADCDPGECCDPSQSPCAP